MWGGDRRGAVEVERMGGGKEERSINRLAMGWTKEYAVEMNTSEMKLRSGNNNP